MKLILSLMTMFSLSAFAIIGGKIADAKKYPWAVYLNMEKVNKGSSTAMGFHCGGAIISDRHIITAAHCVARFKAEHITATISGGSGLTTGPKEVFVKYLYGIKKIHTHDDFTYDKKVLKFAPDLVDLEQMNIFGLFKEKKEKAYNLEHDIAIIETHQKIKITDYIRPIKLEEKSFYRFSELKAIGWGRVSPTTNKKSKRLKEVTLEMLPGFDDTYFWNRTRKVKYLTSLFSLGLDTKGQEESYQKMILLDASKGKSMCNNDSGGPLMSESSDGELKLIGVLSSSNGKGLGCMGKLNFGASVEYNLDWIRSIVDREFDF